ncbi:hypothetical protein ASG88_10275 [Nocardioides sp. Soil777]|uniref:DUF2177 family protein n=1 Tax=Nocardioides sp. Soil777 TaxID=1736409 RepID=UPI0007031098|nr:DUF2177 family protein [Nocardioides sp. Soil777]KRF00809.1 hypothetical protein ASG88_10275 [Nocardioides sp. Soil777]
MRVSAWLTQFLVAAVVFSVIDVLWLSTVATDLYDEQLGALRAESPNVLAAVLVYLVLLAGLVHFVIHPAVAAGSWRRAVGVGAFFGFVVYGVYELTNLAVVDGWPVALVPIDMAWGTFLSAAVGVGTYAVVQRLPAWAR